MCKLEDTLFEANELGLRDEMFKKIKELRQKKESRYLEYKDIVESAFNDLKKK